MDLAEAVRKLKSRTISRIELDELSKHFFPLAINIARKLATRGKEDDFVSAGYFGIAYALGKAPDKLYDDDLESWVKSCIYRFVRRHAVTDHMICVPNTTLREARARGRVIETMQKHQLGMKAHVPRNATRYKDLLDKLETASTDPLDRSIIELRLEGYTDDEIGKMVGKSNSDIHRRRKRLEARFDFEMGNLA